MIVVSKFTLIVQALAGVLAAASSLCAQTPPVAAAAVPVSGPAIRFNTENYDFGKILKGDPVEYAFLATNVGDETLVISDAKGTCSCTVVGEGSNQTAWTPQQVAPGQTCRIPVHIATGSFWFQTISKIVEVTSNDKSRPVATLEIHGQVWLPIEVEPPVSSFILTPGAANQSNDVLKIFNRTETPLTLSDPQCDTNAFSAVLKTNVPGREFELTVTAAPASVPPSTFGMTTIQGSISLKSSAAVMNPLKIGVSETLYPEVTLYPTNIEMPAGPLSQAITNHITIRGNRADFNPVQSRRKCPRSRDGRQGDPDQSSILPFGRLSQRVCHPATPAHLPQRPDRQPAIPDSDRARHLQAGRHQQAARPPRPKAHNRPSALHPGRARRRVQHPCPFAQSARPRQHPPVRETPGFVLLSWAAALNLNRNHNLNLNSVCGIKNGSLRLKIGLLDYD